MDYVTFRPTWANCFSFFFLSGCFGFDIWCHSGSLDHNICPKILSLEKKKKKALCFFPCWWCKQKENTGGESHLHSAARRVTLAWTSAFSSLPTGAIKPRDMKEAAVHRCAVYHDERTEMQMQMSLAAFSARFLYHVCCCLLVLWD